MKKQYWFLGFITLVSVIILVVAMPRKGKVNYDYSLNEPWRYPTLIADFSFTVQKSDEVYHNEVDSLMSTFQPFYNLQPKTCRAEIAQLEADVSTSAALNKRAYVSFIKEQLKEVYSQGIMSAQQLQDLIAHKYAGVRVIHNNVATFVSVEQILTVQGAYERIMHADSVHYKHEQLALYALNNYLKSNLVYDREKSVLARQELLNSVSRSKGVVMKGERVVEKGQKITPQIKERIDSYEDAVEQLSVPKGVEWLNNIGLALLFLILLLVFIIYLVINRPQYIREMHSVTLFYVLIVLFPLITFVAVGTKWFNPYTIPYAMIPLFVSIFFDSRTATMSLMLSILISAIALPANAFDFFLLEGFMGMTAIYALKELTDRAQILKTALYVSCTGLLMQFALNLIACQDLLTLNVSRYAQIAISGVGLLFAYPLIYVIERLFGFTSSVTLIELTNINHPLLKRMSKVAQGTFNHSMQVANLAAEVANKIGANAQLVRTGALYHDIGKMLNPTYFTENQNGINPHDTLEAINGLSKEERSAKIIIDHVTGGDEMAIKNHIPRALRDFIVTHHGKSQTKYFYIQWQNNHPGEEPPKEAFTYPGPNPFTLEQAILMMCDSVEAASRSLKEYTEESISKLVDTIVDGQMHSGFFEDCPITFHDIKEAKKVLIESLKTVYHTRIAYPTLHEKTKEAHRPSLFYSRLRREKS